jgi:hypothetical protein
MAEEIALESMDARRELAVASSAVRSQRRSGASLALEASCAKSAGDATHSTVPSANGGEPILRKAATFGKWPEQGRS